VRQIAASEAVIVLGSALLTLAAANDSIYSRAALAATTHVDSFTGGLKGFTSGLEYDPFSRNI
jgi:hypothetical protein